MSELCAVRKIRSGGNGGRGNRGKGARQGSVRRDCARGRGCGSSFGHSRGAARSAG